MTALMPRSVLIEAASLLTDHYGRLAPPGRAGEWSTLVRVVLDQGRSAKKELDWSWLEEGPLASACDTAQCEVSQLAYILGTQRQPAGKAPVL